MMDIPSRVIEDVRDGRAILFVGAGCSVDAVHENGVPLPSATELRDRLCDHYLNGAHRDESLQYVAELAKNRRTNREVFEFIRAQFHDAKPAAAHHLIPKFRWKLIVTTNYDTLIEQAFASSKTNLQTPTTVVDEDDFRLSEKGADAVPILKIHGCVTRVSDADPPLILADEEIAKYAEQRKSLFESFQDLARSHPIIFCGYRLSDSNIASVLWDLGDTSKSRPWYTCVRPSFSEFEMEYYYSRRISAVPATFNEFLNQLDSIIPIQHRELAGAYSHKGGSAIEQLGVTKDVSSRLVMFLGDSTEIVNKDVTSTGTAPAEFYAGKAYSWNVFEQGFDVRRNVVDEIRLEAFLYDGPIDKSRLVLVKGPAGFGKTVSIDRAIWESAHEENATTVRLNEGSIFDIEALIELASLTDRQVTVYVPSMLEHRDQLVEAFSNQAFITSGIIVIVEARTNEWNSYGGKLQDIASREIEVRRLNRREISELVDNLEGHRCLGVLEQYDKEDRVEKVAEIADRQLLVMLHQATLGKTFQEIVNDEYQNIGEREAQLLYLDVCTLHRLRVPLRAGIVARVSGINYEQFQEQFLSPLEHVVYVRMDRKSGDYIYMARHPVIAEFVFESVLDTPEKRADQLCRILRGMNTSFSSDDLAYTRILNGKRLANMFPSHESVERIFTAAAEGNPNLAHLYHQRAQYELAREGGNPSSVQEYIEVAKAYSKGSVSSAIVHTEARALLARASQVTHPAMSRKLANRAQNLLRDQVKKLRSPYPLSTLGEALLKELKDRDAENAKEEAETGTEAISARARADLIAELNGVIAQGHSRFPDDEYILDLDRKYNDYLGESDQAGAILKRAFEKNPGSGHLACALARRERQVGSFDGAVNILRKSLDHNASQRDVHALLARTLIDWNENEYNELILWHLRNSFSPGDSNIEAHYWFARQHFLYGDINKAQSTYEHLKRARISPRRRKKPRGMLLDNQGTAKSFSGVVKTVRSTFAFIRSVAIRDDVYLAPESWHGDWDTIQRDQKVQFNLAFSFLGPVAVDAQSEE